MKKIYNQFGFTKLRYTLLVCVMAVSITSWGQLNQTVKAVAPTAKIAKTTANFDMQDQNSAPSTGRFMAPMRAIQTKDVCDGQSTNEYLPLWGYYYDDNYQINQMIYPSSLLTDLVGAKIYGLTFYANSSITLTSGTFNIRLGTTTQSTYGTTITRITGLTTVASACSMTSCISGNNLVITFDTPFTYTGGNLVIDYQTVARGNNYAHTYFYGNNNYTNASFYSRGSSNSPNSNGVFGTSSRASFLPKVTFSYEITPTITASPTAVTLETKPGNSVTSTITVTGSNLTQGITATLNDANGVYSLNPTSLNSNGGNLVLTYSPSTEGTHNATITLTGSGADPVTITINGTCANSTLVCDGTQTNGYLPIYGYYYDNYQKNQMIYPQSYLTELVGKKLTSMTFYANADFNFNGGQVTARLGTTTDQNNYTTMVRLQPTDMDIVASGFDVPSGGSLWKIVFTTPFVYNGGNLVVDIEETSHGSGTGHYSSQNFAFYGVTQTGGGFYSNGSSYNSTFSTLYSGSIQPFLPKVKFEWEDTAPITAGTVSPQSLTFTDVETGTSPTQTVTITNTGNQNFTPVIDTTNLPAEFTVTGAAQVTPHNTINLTVTYSPTAVGTNSGSFTVTIGDQTYTVTVTGNAIKIDHTLISNDVMVRVYKSDIRFIGHEAFSEQNVIADRDRTVCEVNAEVNDVDVHAKTNFTDINMPITGYDLMRKNNGASWATAATISHDGSTDEWKNMIDNAGSETAYYVPVTKANSIAGNPNTYGSAQEQVQNYTLTAQVAYAEMSSKDKGANYWRDANGNVYTHYQVQLDINQLLLPFGMEDNEDYDLYMVRVWRQVDDISILNEQTFPTDGANAGKNRPERIDDDFLFEEVVYPEYSKTSVFNQNNRYNLGSSENLTYLYPNWTKSGTNETRATFGALKLRETGEGGDTVASRIDLTFLVRAYYTHVDNLPNGNRFGGSLAPTRDGDGKFYVMEYEFDYTLEPGGVSTGIGSVIGERQVVGVTYYNTMGMESNRPFEGVNIVVTRYSDGSVSTTKALLRK